MPCNATWTAFVRMPGKFAWGMGTCGGFFRGELVDDGGGGVGGPGGVIGKRSEEKRKRRKIKWEGKGREWNVIDSEDSKMEGWRKGG